jgi:hypothetical protein
MGILNKGTITANQGNTLYVQPSGAGVSNRGFMQAVNGGTLVLYNGNFDNPGGTIQALGGTVQLNNSTLVSTGTVQALNGGTVQLYNGAYVKNSSLTTDSSSMIQTEGIATLENVTLTNGSTFQGPQGSITNIRGTITNNGTIAVAGAWGNQAGLVLDNGSATLSGTGTVTLGGSYDSSFITANDPSWVLTNDTNHTITGSGNVGGWGGMGILNKGTITANQGNTLYVQPSGAGLDNQGTLSVASGGTMVIVNNLNNYAAGTLTGGIYNVAGIMALPVPTSESIQTNAATIILDGPSSAIMKYADSSNALAGFASNTALGDFTIKNGANFVTAGAFNNAGAMTFETGSTFTVGGTNTAYTQTAGITTVNGSLIGSLVSIQGGTLKGSGTVTGNVTVGATGTVHPGNSPGVLTVNGNYTNTGILGIDIFNLAQGPGAGYSELVVNGTATLGGILQISLSPQTVLHTGEIFDIIYALNGFTGEFTSITGLSSDFTEQFGSNYVDLVATKDVNPVPVPPSLVLFAGGLAGLIGLRRRVGRKVSRGNAI